MIPAVYILHSKKLNKYYIGFTTLAPEQRLKRHLGKFYEEAGSFTKKASDWALVWQIQCSAIEQARNIEKHIKNMKSRKYIENLVKYVEIGERLLALYDPTGASPSSR